MLITLVNCGVVRLSPEIARSPRLFSTVLYMYVFWHLISDLVGLPPRISHYFHPGYFSGPDSGCVN